jgi:hypothetical protein
VGGTDDGMVKAGQAWLHAPDCSRTHATVALVVADGLVALR